MSGAKTHSRWLWSAGLLLLAILEVWHRTPPVRCDSFFFDFSNVYSASRAWLHGQNAYQMSTVYSTWAASNHGQYLGTSNPAGMSTWAAVYPPSSLLMFSPFAALDAVPAHGLWMAFNVFLLSLTLLALMSLANIRDWSLRVLLVSCTLACSPVQCALDSGQPALPASALVIPRRVAYSRDSITLAGVLLGIAAAIKIQIGGPFILFYLFLRQWRMASIASMLFLSITLVAVVRLDSAGVNNWFTEWRQNVAATLEPGQINDPRAGGPFRHDMVNLQTLFDVPLHSDASVDALVIAVFLPMVLLFLSLVRPSPEAGKDLLKLSLVGVLSMLPLYHRLYDAILLLMLLAWAIGNLQNNRRTFGIIGLSLLAELLIPIDTVPAIERRIHVPDIITSSSWWQGFVIPHHAWAILSLSIGTLYMLWRIQEPMTMSVLSPGNQQMPTPTPPTAGSV